LRVDKLVREYRDERGREIQMLEILGARLNVKKEKLEEIIMKVMSYKLHVEEAVSEIKKNANTAP